MTETKIVVLGAGVTGLTTAHHLLETFSSSANNGIQDINLSITIVAKHMPGDYDISYASPWAGANYFPVAKEGSAQQGYETVTWKALEGLARDRVEAGVHFQDAYIYRRKKDVDSPVGQWFGELVREDAWFRNVVPNFEVLPQDELPPGCEGGTKFTSVCINTAIYLPWLASQCLKKRAVIKRGIVRHISDAASLHHSGETADFVINCTGLGSLDLGGVQDKQMYPARGQIVVVRNETEIMSTTSGTDDRDDEAVYVMGRAAGGGTVLGGCLQAGNWESQPDPNLAVRIMKRSVELCPKLVPAGQGIEGLSIIRHGVGLRPARNGGIRIEEERIGGVRVIHNYGHAGYGYQTSFGCAEAVEELLRDGIGWTRSRL